MIPKEHTPVLLEEVIHNLALKSGNIVVDCTLGFAGHTVALAQVVGNQGKVIAIDQDIYAIKKAKQYIKKAGVEKQVVVIHDNFVHLQDILQAQAMESVNGVLIDAGVSSYQLDEADRGFSYKAQNLDMRMDRSQKLTAEKIINNYSQRELERMFKEHAEEHLARPIARSIVRARKKGPLSAQALVELIEGVYRRIYKRKSTTHPAAKVFLALRIEVNDELYVLERALKEALMVLAPQGRVAIITFHSGEHRIVKKIFRQEARDCICASEIPICTCAHRKQIQIITKKPIIPSRAEISLNPRARSAHLYVAEKI